MSSFRRRLMMAQGGGKSALEPCIYTTTSANQSVKIIYRKQYAQRIYLEDGTELDVSGSGELTYTFPEAGEHKVWIEFKEDVTNFSNCFYGCSGLTSIPENLFANNTAVTYFNNCFYDCSGLTSIPENLFANNTAVTYFSHCFQYCSGLTSIPANLFANNTAVTNFSGCFVKCSGLTGSIPENLFANNTAVTYFNNCFYDCSGLTSIPANLFANNTAVTDFSYCFYGCTNITSSCPIDNDGTPIYNRSSGKSGYSKVTSYPRCFNKCTKMADYSSIPSGWK